MHLTSVIKRSSDTDIEQLHKISFIIGELYVLTLIEDKHILKSSRVAL